MNHSAIGVIAVGAPGSEARKRTNREAFLTVYRNELEIAVSTHPEEYSYPLSETPKVFEHMTAAIDRRSFNKDSRAFKSTCKVLGLKHTYQAINSFLNGD